MTTRSFWKGTAGSLLAVVVAVALCRLLFELTYSQTMPFVFVPVFACGLACLGFSKLADYEPHKLFWSLLADVQMALGGSIGAAWGLLYQTEVPPTFVGMLFIIFWVVYPYYCRSDYNRFRTLLKPF